MSDWLRTATLSLVLGAIVVAAAGCGGSSFVGRQYDNFTAYYNTFYNAQDAFDEGVKALERTDRPLDRRYYVDVFTAPDQAGNASNFQDAIDKSADVLRDHPNSRWVDDALLLIGKSYFYLRNFVGAEQKFREVIDIGSALEDEAHLWLARTLIAAGSYNDAMDHLTVALEQEDLSERWEPRLRLALGELYVKRQDYEAAAEELDTALEAVRDNELEARGWMLLGQVLETVGRYEDAVAAFDRVSRAHPRYELSYAANVSAIRVLGLHVDSDEALRRLRRMQRDDKNFGNRLELAYLSGLILQSEGRVGDARELYYDVLYDSDGQLGDLRGRIHYALGELYQSEFNDYVAAAAHYDTASTALTNRATAAGRAQEQFAPEAIADAPAKAEMFRTFAGVRTQIARMDSLLELGSLEEEAFMEQIMEIRRQRARELSAQQREVEQRQAQRGFQDVAARGQSRQTQLATEQAGEAGFLFHRDRVQVQENRMNFIMQWGERPHVLNWRRAEAVAAAVSEGDVPDDAVTARILDSDAEAGEEPLPQIDFSDVPRDSLNQARMRAQRALARYELGNVLFLSMERPDSAAAWYRMVIEEDPGESVAQRAYYALAEVQRSLGDTARAQSLYEQVLRDFPTSDFAGRVREQLGIREDVSSDSLAMASDDYDEAARQWQRGDHRRALDEMVSLAAAYRQMEVAPKALLAAGRIYLELAEKDSLDVFGPLPLSVEPRVLREAGLLAHRAELAAVNSPADSGAAASSGSPPNAGPSAPASSPEAGSSVPPVRSDEPASPTEASSPVAASTEASSPVATSTEASSPVTAANETSSTSATADSTLLSADVAGGELEAEPQGGVMAEQDTAAIYIETVYESIKQHYPTTLYARQADEMLHALQNYRAELQAAADSVRAAEADTIGVIAEVDSTAETFVADSLAAGELDSVANAGADSVANAGADSVAASLAASDSTAATMDRPAERALEAAERRRAEAALEQPDSSETGSIAESRADTLRSIPTGEASLRGEGGIDVELGGFTLVLGMNVEQEPMEALARKYAENGFRTDVITERVGGTTLYRAAIGHFASAGMAHRALQQHGDELDEGVQVAPVRRTAPSR